MAGAKAPGFRFSTSDIRRAAYEDLSPDLGAPQPLIVRIESIPPRHRFADHAHPWNQLVYAISGVLTVNIEGSCFVIPPEQAAWVPVATRHRVGSLLGAEFRSLWLDNAVCTGISTNCVVFSVSPLLRALIIEAATLQDEPDDAEYAERVVHLIVDQLRRAHPLPAALPWPRQGPLTSCGLKKARPTRRRM